LPLFPFFYLKKIPLGKFFGEREIEQKEEQTQKFSIMLEMKQINQIDKFGISKLGESLCCHHFGHLIPFNDCREKRIWHSYHRPTK